MKKILVIDDDRNLVELIKKRLEANGYAVVSALDGLEGLEKVDKENPDLIILDIKMAKMDGYTMLRKLDEDDRSANIPVIILTGYDGMQDLFELEGIRDYILKPFDGQDLLLRISRALNIENTAE